MKSKKPTVVPKSTPRNPLAVPVKTRGGAGKHKDRKRESKNNPPAE
jgi:hypothetical protein